MTRRECLQTIGSGVLATAGSSVSFARDADRIHPNILLIHTDEHRIECLGAYGNTDIKTPHIDLLAANGVLYSNSYCPFPVCTPSRYSLITGQYVHRHRAFSNHSTLPPGTPTFPRMLQDRGYKTKAVGKMHFTPTYQDVGFAEMELSEQDGPGRWDDDYHRYLMERDLVDRNDLEDQRSEYRKNAPQDYFDSFGAMVSNLPEAHHSTTWIGDRAVETLRQWEPSSSQLLMVGFIKPHHPFDPPAPWHEMYDPQTLSLLPGWTEDCLPRDYDYSRGYFDHAKLNRDAIRRVMAYYYASISQIDYHVGRMIDVLKEKNLYDTTTIVFTSDHGDNMGFHHLLLKGSYMYDPIAKVPLIIKFPKNERAGTVSASQVNNIDLAPTLLRTAGVAPAPEMQGLDLHQAGAGHEIVFCGRTEVMARTKEHKLLVSRRQNGQNLFFDLQADPLEMTNRYDDPKYQRTIADLNNAIDAWQAGTDLQQEAYLDEDAPQIDQPNVPSHDRSHREVVIEYYRQKMEA